MKQLTLRKQVRHWLLKQGENSLDFNRNLKYDYITSAILHLNHRGKTTLSKIKKTLSKKTTLSKIKKKKKLSKIIKESRFHMKKKNLIILTLTFDKL